MSRKDIDLIKEMYVAFHGGDVDRALSYFDQDVVVDARARIDGGIGHGRDDLSRIIGQWLSTFDEWREEIEQIRDLGDRVCVVALQGGRGKDSGIETQTRYAIIYEVHGDAITRMTRIATPPKPSKPPG